MVKFIKDIIKYIIMFVFLFACSLFVTKIFSLMNLKFENEANIAFIAALLSFVFILCIQNYKKTSSKNKNFK